MKITTAKLTMFAPRIMNAQAHAEALEDARLTSCVTTPRRLCHFMGQIFVETGGFTAMVENMDYRSPEWLDAIFRAVKGIEDAKALIAKGPEAIANRVYANRYGNGDEASGDGWRYRGSGYKQITFRDNYVQIGALVGIDIASNPVLARAPATAAKIAFAFWRIRGCSKLADCGDTEGITSKINGPTRQGLAERRKATLRAMEIWK